MQTVADTTTNATEYHESKLSFLWRSLLRSKTGLVGLIITTIVILLAIFAPLVSPHDPVELDTLNTTQPPAWVEGGSMDHVLGTDNLGRDILSRIIYGTRISLLVGVLSVIVSGAVGMILGMIAGYYKGFADSVIMRVADSFHAVPKVLFAMVVLAVLGSGVPTLIFVIGVTSWVTFARLIRSEVLTIKEKEFVKASVTIGTPHFLILFKHILPNVVSSFVVLATISIAENILTEAALSFLGVGIQPPLISWGGMLSDGRSYLATNWWVATFPGLAITITVLGIMFLGYWVRDVLDPHNHGK